MRFAYILVVVYFHVPAVLAHGDLHARIEALSVRIKQVPKDIELYQQRGELLLQHDEYADARRDFERCRRHGHTSARLYHYLGKTYFHLQKFKKSKYYLQLSLGQQPTDIKSLRLLAMCHVARYEYPEAIMQYSKWIEHSIRPRPAIYLELANVYFLNEDVAMSIHTMQQGISKLGLHPALSTQLLGYYKMNQDYQSAIGLQTEVILVCARKEFALFERALLFQSQNNHEASQHDLIAATACIEKLPAHVRKGSRIRELVRSIEEQQIKSMSTADE